MSDVAGAVVAALRARAGRSRIRVGVFYRGDLALLLALLAEGHPTVVAGDRFRALHKAAERLGPPGARRFSIVEARFDALPFAPASLDALVLARGLPSGGEPEATIAALKPFLAPGGVLVFPHPVTDGRRGFLASASRVLRRGMQRPCRRHVLCASAMGAGFRDVRQLVPAGRGAVPWIVTSGSAGRADAGRN
jgi:hypothetical protein